MDDGRRVQPRSERAASPSDTGIVEFGHAPSPVGTVLAPRSTERRNEPSGASTGIGDTAQLDRPEEERWGCVRLSGTARESGATLAVSRQIEGRRPDDAVRIHAQARAHDRAHARPDAPGRSGRVRVRLALRQPRPVARPLPAADPDGRRHRPAASRDVRHEPRHPRTDRHRVVARDARRAVRRPDGPGHRPRRLGAARARQAPDHARPHGRGDPRHPGARGRRDHRLRGHRPAVPVDHAAGRCPCGSPATARWRSR